MKVAHFGTFDVDNYGDLLFPKIAEWRIPDIEWLHVSPVGGKSSFIDSSISLSTTEVSDSRIDAVIVGGGNIVHFERTKLSTYKSVANSAYSSLWLGAAKLAAKNNVPLIFNAPSISNLTKGTIEKYIFNQVFKQSEYISFREKNSSKLFSQFDCHVVPDTVIDISRMWPKEERRYDENYIVIHVNNRYITNFSNTLAAIESISKTLNAKVVLLPIGPCHGDILLARKIMEQSSIDIQLETELNLKKFAMLIANAKAYIGSSMHGFITAYSYNTPGIMVLNQSPLHKFSGLLDVLNVEKKIICPSWEAAVRRIDKQPLIGTNNNLLHSFEKLDNHWNDIVSAIHAKREYKKQSSISHCDSVIKIAKIESKFKRLVNKIIDKTGH